MGKLAGMKLTRHTQILCSLLLVLGATLGFTSAATAEDFRIENSTYRVDVTGQYINEWHGQTSGYPGASPWSWEHGKVTAGFRTPGGVRYRGSKFFGDLPGKTPLPTFQFQPLRQLVAKSNNRAEFKRKINYVPFCGGELGECDGTEKSGVEATSRSCKRPNSKIPIVLDYDQEGHNPLIRINLGQHRSMTEFCGEKYPGENSISPWPNPVFFQAGLKLIASLKKGESIGRERTFERGWIGGDNHPEGARHLKKCPPLDGLGSRQCWILDLKIQVKRIK